ncbi:MFS general substrate transporter [Myriangium duriaei CBS 260.36]|uniref:MFS general substrate transporter n=1 Tax=Myriangium duriaei CBS 260.36 TaxID=1168546 RepID=A0A9P4MFZ2_9PEZI|nr:MFS general substrate transporter [Myriangium duriaei CBS 260.36]
MAAPRDSVISPKQLESATRSPATEKQDFAQLEKTDTQYEKVDNTSDGSENGGPLHQQNTFERTMGHRDRLHRQTTVDSSVGHKLTLKLFLALVAMSFLWVGSQIPLYLFGGGGYDRWVWATIAYFIPVAALCPFVGIFSDLFGRKQVGLFGQLLLIIGPVVVSTAHSMNVVIGGMVISGAGAGLNELIALAATGEMVPTAKRGAYVGMVVMTIIPFAPSVLWAELIVQASSWRYIGAFVAAWNALGFIFLAAFYWPPPRPNSRGMTKMAILKQIDYLGAILSIGGVTAFMMGLQWGAQQYPWNSVHVLVPFFIGFVLIVCFFGWEMFGAKYPMVPHKLFSRAKRTMIVTLLITFLSGGNFFATEIYNVYGNDRIAIGIRSLPVGFGILGGAVISLLLIPITKGNVRAIMLFFTALMTAGTGAVAVARPDNMSHTYAAICLACIGVGGIIIPVAIIAQIVCPDELLGTITAISLSIRFVGGAIGFSVYYNVFYKNVFSNIQSMVAIETIIYKLGYVQGLSDGDQSYVTNLAQSIAQAEYKVFDNLSAMAFATPEVAARVPGLTLDQFRYQITQASHLAFAYAYRYPFWISIAFGGSCFILAFFLGDVSPYLTQHVAVGLEDNEQVAEGHVDK